MTRLSPRAAALKTAALGSCLFLFTATCTEERAPLSPEPPASPPPAMLVTGSGPPAVLVGAGDIADCAKTGDSLTARILDTIPGTVFTAGDNAYPDGTDAQFSDCYEPTWGRHKARTRPAVGDHEYNTPGASGYFNYFGATAGEVGKGYYSYELGAWHVIVLNSNITRSVGSPQETWLRADLAAHSNQCTVAIWHHPLYSSNGGTATGGAIYSSVRPFWDDLYAAGADLVLNGHRHGYERLAPMKPDGTADPAYGLRTIVPGTGGEGGGSQTNVFPTSEVRNGNTFGVLKLTLYDDSYSWKFIRIVGKTFSDSGSALCHGAPGSGPAISPALSAVSAAPTTLTAGGGTATITVTVKDVNGNPVSGATVALSASGSGNTLTQPAGPTNASGIATGTLGSTVAGPKTVTATANGIGITQTATVTVAPGPVSASQSTLTASPTTIPASTGAATIIVTARDAYGNSVSGASVQLAASGTGNTFTPSSGTTNSSGVLPSDYSSSVAEGKTISASINGVAVTQTATVTVIAQPVSASLSTIAASPTSIVAVASCPSPCPEPMASTITVIAKDGNGNPVSGVTVLVVATGGGNTITQPAAPTNASGVATGTLSSTVPESKTIFATVNGNFLAQTATVTVTAGPVSASQSTVAASPTSIPMGGGPSTITVTAKDANGNPISGATVVLAATGSGNTLSQPSGTTSANGVATGTLSSTVAEAKTVSATINGVAVTQTATVTVTSQSVSAALSTVAASLTSISVPTYCASPPIPCPETSSTITVTVKDVNGSPISGAAVVLSATGSGNTLTQPAGPTNSNGVATGTLGSTVAETKTVSASANGTMITQSATVTVTGSGGGAGTITPTLLTAGNNPANQGVFTTASIAPAPNTLVTIAVLSHRSTAATPSPTISGGGMSAWTEVATTDFDTLSLTHKRLTLFRAMSAAPGNGPITITYSATVSNCQWIVAQWDGVETSGVNGAGAIGQTGTNRADAVSGLTVSLSAFGSAGNVGYGVFAVNSMTPVITPGAGFTEIAEQASAESPYASLMTEWKANGNTINATWTSLKGGALGIELKAKTAP